MLGRGRRALATAIALLVAVSGLEVAATAPAVDAAGDAQIITATPGPLGPVTVIGDSVLVGASYEPSLPTLLTQQGWGPIRFRAGLGYTTGRNQPKGSTFSAVTWINAWRASGWDPADVVVNLGNNDVGFCGADLACNAANIRYLLDAIGPGHTVWWSKITRLYTQQDDADAFNGALDLVASERSNLRVWDWPTARLAAKIPTAWDGIHLPDVVSYRARSVLMAADITRQLATATRTGSAATLPTVSALPDQYRSATPTRVLDTRTTGGRLAAGATAVIDLSTMLPQGEGSSAVAVNLTAVAPATDGFLTAHPCAATPPTASSVNYTAGTDRGALAVVPLTVDGRICVTSSAATDLVVDLQGSFGDIGVRFDPVTPRRLVDTRDSGRRQVIELDVGAVRAVALNITVTGAAVPGFVTVYPCMASGVPTVSNVNFQAGETVAGAAFGEVWNDGKVCLFTNTPDVDVIVDLTGTFRTNGTLGFVAAPPTRTYDTRVGVGGWTPVHGALQTTDVRVAPDTAVAVTGTLTIVEPVADGFLTAFPCGDVPPTSNVNSPRGGIRANSVTVGLAAGGRVCIRSLTTTQVVFDTTGWWVP